MKILSVIASCAGERSATAALSDMLFKNINSEVFNGNAEYERITLDSADIKLCTSCKKCFQKRYCPMDEKDDMKKLKNKILECDILILGSPVYLGHISGVCKVLLDRLSYWSHSMEIMGKYCIAVSTASNNHGSAAVDYIEEILRYMGGIVVFKLNAYIDVGYPLFKNDREICKAVGECADNLRAGLKDPALFITETQERYFIGLNSRYKKALKFYEKYPFFADSESSVWHEHGYDTAETFKQAVNIKKSGNDKV